MADPVPPIEPAASAQPAAAATPPVAVPEPVPPSPAPASHDPAAAPAADVAPLAAVADAPAPAAEPAAPVPALDKTLLEKFDEAQKAKDAKPEPAKDAAKPTDAKSGDAKGEPKPGDKTDAKAAEAAAEPPAPIEYKFDVPESIKADDPRMGQFTGLLNEARVAPELAQKILNLAGDAFKAYDAQLREAQYDQFNRTKAGWEKKCLADTEIGGAGHETAMAAIARTRDILVSSAKPGTPRYEQERAEFDQFLAVTGAGSHPSYLRMVHNAARFVDEPQARDLPAEIRPPKGNGRAPRGNIYTHPSSANMDKA